MAAAAAAQSAAVGEGQGVDGEDVVPSFDCPALRERQELEARLIAQIAVTFGDEAESYVLKCLKQLGYPDSVDASAREPRIPPVVSAAASDWRGLCDAIETARLAAMTAEQRAAEALRLAARDELDRRTLVAFRTDINRIGSMVMLSRTMRVAWVSATSVWDRVMMLHTLGFMTKHDQMILMNVSPGCTERADAMARCVSRVLEAHQDVWSTVGGNMRREGVDATSERVSCAYDESSGCLVSAPCEGIEEEEDELAAAAEAASSAASAGGGDGRESSVVFDMRRWLEGQSVDWSIGSADGAVAGSHTSHSRGVRLYDSDNRAVTTDHRGELILWDVSVCRRGGKAVEMKRFKAHSTQTCGLRVSPDESLIATGCYDGSVKLWTADGDAVRTLREAPGGDTSVYSVCFSADGRRVLAAGHHESALLEFDVEGVRAVRVIPAGGQLMAVDASADGQWAVTTDHAGQVKIWDGTSLAEMRTLDGSGSKSCWGARFSPDSSHVAVVSNDKHLRVWQTSDWSKTIDIEAHSNHAYKVCWSSDSKQIVTSSSDATVKVWEASSGRLLRTLTGHTAWTWGVAMSADGKMIMSCGNDKTVRVWRHEAVPHE